LALGSPAGAWSLALLPPVTDGQAAGALRSQAAELGLGCDTLTAAQLTDRAKFNATAYPLAVLVGGERFPDTVADEGDATASLQAYVDGGGSLLVAADGPVLARPQRWTGTGWEAATAPLRKVALGTRLGLLDAGQSLETAPPAGCLLAAGSKSYLAARLPEKFAPPADAGPYRPIPGSQDPSVEFNPLLTLVDAQGGTFGAAVAEIRRKGVEGAGSVFYVWAPLLLAPQGRDLVLGLLTLRAERFATEPRRVRARALGEQLATLGQRLAEARRVLPDDLKNPEVDALRADLKQHGETLGWLREALAVGNDDFVADRLAKLKEPVGSLLARAGMAVDAAVITAVATAVGPVEIPLKPALATVGTAAAPPDAAGAATVVDPAPGHVTNVGEVLLVPDVQPRAESAPPVTPPTTPPTAPPTTPPVAPPSATRPGVPPATPPTTPPTATPTAEKPRFATTNPVIELQVKDRGSVFLELLPDVAPKTCSSFLYLARSGFYERTYFHRRIEKFVVQGGDPFTRDNPPDSDKIGRGGPDYTVPGEFSTTLSHQRGTVGLARAPRDPDSGGSQFYICLEPQPGLDREYAIFAKVIAGMEVVDKIQIGDRILKVRITQGADATNPPGVGPLNLFDRKP
jgi:cyclophilin family peptidyl-prolyl cis-trans isomerase